MPVVNTTNTFTNNEQITSTKLNDIMDNSSFVSGAVVTSGGLEITVGGQMQIASDGVTTARILNSNVTTAKIADGAVTPAKLSTSGPSWDIAGGTFLFSQRVLEVGYGITSNTDSIIDFHAVHPLTDREARIIRASGENGTFSISNNGTGAITLSSSGGVTFGSANMPTPTGNAPIYGARAWANIAISPTRSVASQANVTSASKIDTTHTQITFTTAMPDDVYVVTGCAKNDAALEFSTYDHQTTGFKIRHSTETAGRFVQFIVMR
jgi:hypothetical protein